MPRYKFTERDLEPFRIFFDHPLAQQALSGAVPIKQLASPPSHVEEAAVPLAVDVQSHETPHGVPLHDVLVAVQKEVPSVQGMAIRNGNVVMTHSDAPSAADRQKIARILSDPQLLKPAAAAVVPTIDPLVKKLTDPATPDADWIKGFREYAVKNLIKGA